MWKKEALDEFASFQKKVTKVLETGNEAMFQDECLFAKLQCDRKKFKCLFRQSKTVVVLNPRLAVTGLRGTAIVRALG